MIGCYYLHTNGELIFKPAAVFNGTTTAEYFESDFVVMWWFIPTDPPAETREECALWVMDKLSNAYKLSSNKAATEKCIRKICQTNGLPEMIIKAILEGKKAKVIRAGEDTETPGAIVGVGIDEEENKA